eukprot:SAG31_NODE_6366_length_2042_cov_1.531652_2_plen_445_part_00
MSASEHRGDETGLAVPTAIDERKQLCHACGEPGHFARSCPKGEPNCWICGAVGHISSSCPDIRHPMLRAYDARGGDLTADTTRFSVGGISDFAPLNMCRPVSTTQESGNGAASSAPAASAYCSCFARRIVFLAPAKHLFPPTSDKIAHKRWNAQSRGKAPKGDSSAPAGAKEVVQKIRHDVLARVAMQAIFLGHAVRRNVTFEVFAKEGCYVISPNVKAGLSGKMELEPTQQGVLSYLKGAGPRRYAHFPPMSESSAVPKVTKYCDVEGGTSVGVPSSIDKEQLPVASLRRLVYLDERAPCDFEQYVEQVVEENSADSDNILAEHAEQVLADFLGSETSGLRVVKTRRQIISESAIRVLEAPILLGDHEGLSKSDLDFARAEFAARTATRTPLDCHEARHACDISDIDLVPVTLSPNSLLASSCVAVVHYILDKWHVCKPWRWI